MVTLEVGKRDMPTFYAMPETTRVLTSTFRFAISETYIRTLWVI